MIVTTHASHTLKPHRTVRVQPGETDLEAIARHRRQTGHRGACILFAAPRRHVHQAA